MSDYLTNLAKRATEPAAIRPRLRPLFAAAEGEPALELFEERVREAQSVDNPLPQETTGLKNPLQSRESTLPIQNDGESESPLKALASRQQALEHEHVHERKVTSIPPYVAVGESVEANEDVAPAQVLPSGIPARIFPRQGIPVEAVSSGRPSPADPVVMQSSQRGRKEAARELKSSQSGKGSVQASLPQSFARAPDVPVELDAAPPAHLPQADSVSVVASKAKASEESQEMQQADSRQRSMQPMAWVPPRVRRPDSRKSEEREPDRDAEVTIEISIGRIDIRAVSPPQVALKRAAEASPAKSSLDLYLEKQRAGGRA